MRYYKIVITDPRTGEILIPNYNGKPGFSRLNYSPLLASYTSLYQGGSVTTLASSNPAALQVQFDIPTGFMHEALQDSFIRIFGVTLQEIAQGANLNGMNIAVYGGMAKGLPLANPSQSGLLCSGMILQCFGNWVGVNQTLDIYMAVGGSSVTANQVTGTQGTIPIPTTSATPANITFQWQPGQPLMTPTVQAIQQAYPMYSVKGAINPNLVWVGTAATAVFGTLSQFASYLNKASLNLIGGYAPDTKQYPGVALTLQNNTISITDGTTATTPKQIQVVDLIGQPTWGDPYAVQVTCVLRADIKVGDFVKLPSLPGQTTSGSRSQWFSVSPGNTAANAKNDTIFTGTFQVAAVRHVGNSRDSGGESWVTTLDISNRSTPASIVDTLPTVYVGQNTSGFFLPR